MKQNEQKSLVILAIIIIFLMKVLLHPSSTRYFYSLAFGVQAAPKKA